MNIQELLGDKSIKPKVKTETLSRWLLDKKLSANDLVDFAVKSKDSPKATCIESLEYASKQKPEIVNDKAFDFVTSTLCEKAPRVKWESAKVIGNTAKLFPNKLEPAIKNLIDNTEHEGTVVRWSAAFALGEIYKLGLKYNKIIEPLIKHLAEAEEKNSIKKIYKQALKK